MEDIVTKVVDDMMAKPVKTRKAREWLEVVSGGQPVTECITLAQLLGPLNMW
jgi:hypothetical protein